MTTVETVGKIRRRHFVKGESISWIAREQVHVRRRRPPGVDRPDLNEVVVTLWMTEAHAAGFVRLVAQAKETQAKAPSPDS